ncbi:MAG: hypothetical protein U0794_09105 [Isosphaeraceae bacterium]
MSDSVPQPHVPTEVAAAQEPWPVEPAADVPSASDEDEAASGNAGSDTEDIETDSEEPAAITGAELARVTADRLHGLAAPAQIGLVVLGSLWAFHRLSTEASPGSGPFGFLIVVGLVLVGALILGAVLHGAAALLHAQADQTESTARIEQHLSDGLERLAAAIERMATRSVPVASPADTHLTRLAELRQAIRTRAWSDASALIAEIQATHPDDPEVMRLATELAAARQTAAADLIARIAAAREVNDPERVLELRDELAGHGLTEPEAQHELDRDLARWFMILIHRRLRTGSIRADVAVLAGRVAQSLDGTAEGASLRASLPTLRRAAGLCPRCAQPYKGVADACPSCLAGALNATAPPAPSDVSPAPEPIVTATAGADDDLEPPPRSVDESDPLAQPWANPDPESR